MARLDTTGIDEVIQDMERLGEMAGETAVQMVEAGAQEMVKAWQQTADREGLRKTGAMIDSMTAGEVVNTGTMVYSEISAQGKDDKGTRNAEKAFILHYGKKGFPATYWVDDAEKAGEGPAQERMESIWDAFIKS